MVTKMAIATAPEAAPMIKGKASVSSPEPPLPLPPPEPDPEPDPEPEEEVGEGEGFAANDTGKQAPVEAITKPVLHASHVSPE